MWLQQSTSNILFLRGALDNHHRQLKKGGGGGLVFGFVVWWGGGFTAMVQAQGHLASLQAKHLPAPVFSDMYVESLPSSCGWFIAQEQLSSRS